MRDSAARSSFLDAEEGKRHTTTRLTFENDRHKVEYDEHDLVKNSTEKKEMDIAPCTYEITGALASFRGMDLPPGKWATFPITDGKKMAHGKIEAQAKENVKYRRKELFDSPVRSLPVRQRSCISAKAGC